MYRYTNRTIRHFEIARIDFKIQAGLCHTFASGDGLTLSNGFQYGATIHLFEDGIGIRARCAWYF